MSRSLYLRVAAVCVLAVSSVTAIPLSSYESLRFGTAHGALNQRLSPEQSHGATPIAEQWLTQKLDHNDLASRETFQQRYFVNDSFVDLTTPRVFYMLGGEGPVSSAYVSDHFVTGQLGQQYKALIVTLEHRFYGKSIPGNDSSTANLKYLSSDLALEDAVQFREHITEQYKLPANTMWVVFGGSYSGALAAWARLKYPNLFVGAFATSGPVQAQLDFHQYFDVVARSVGPACNRVLRNSTQQLEALLATPAGRTQLQTRFNLCSSIASDNDVANFLSTLTGPIAGVVQYSDDNNKYQMYDVQRMCERLQEVSDPLEALTNVWNDYNTFQASLSNSTVQCTDINYDNFIASMQTTSDARSWTYQTCNEFGYFQWAKNDSVQPFSSLISLDFYVQQCTDIFKGAPAGFTPNTQYVNDFYGGNRIVTDNTVFVNGDVDPWQILGNYQTYRATDLSDTILVAGTAH